MVNYQTPPNWVAERAKCNLDLVFEALCQVIERDVNEMNGLPRQQRQDRTFSFALNVDGTKPIALVSRNSEEQKAWARFEKSIVAIQIQVFMPGMMMPQFLAYPEWIQRTRSCVLTVEERQYQVWELSQKALGPLFFGD